MRHLSPKFIEGLNRSQLFNPAPFPGRFPIRWRLEYRHGEKLLSYTGKPNILIARQFTWLSRNKPGFMVAKEFDRKNLICAAQAYTPQRLDPHFRNALLIYYYRQNTGGRPVEWMHDFDVTRQLVLVNGQEHWIYVPNNHEERDLLTWRNWLIAQQAPKPTPSAPSPQSSTWINSIAAMNGGTLTW